MKLSFKGIIMPALVLCAICIVSVAALAGTNELTRDKIKESAQKAAEETRLIVLPEAQDFEEVSDDENTYYKGTANAETVGYVFETEAKGYGGTVKVMTGISTDGKVTGVALLEHEETPGLGANAAKEEFTDKYKGDVPTTGFTVGGGEEVAGTSTDGADAETEATEKKEKTDGETTATEKKEDKPSAGAIDRNIEAMTGATVTTRAVTDAVNKAVEMFHSIEKGGK